MSDTTKSPQTIEELKQWYADRGLPPYEVTRFFIGENYKGAKAFGIYEEDGVFTVYKNKADGTRAVRYSGTDEAFAVEEILDKLKSEILNQKGIDPDSVRDASSVSGGKKRTSIKDKMKNLGGSALFIAAFGFLAYGIYAHPFIFLIILLVPPVLFYAFVVAIQNEFLNKRVGWIIGIYVTIATIIMCSLFWKWRTPNYYRVNDRVYCSYDRKYYEYDDDNDDYYWIDVDYVPTPVLENDSSYYYSTEAAEWDSSYSFEDSNYYNTYIDPPSSSSDSDYDWGSDSSWDSDSTDWDSDW